MALNDYLPNPEKEATDAKRKLEQDTNHDSKIMYDRICKAIAAEIRSGITVAEGKIEFLYSSFISHPEGNRKYISREVQTKHSFWAGKSETHHTAMLPDGVQLWEKLCVLAQMDNVSLSLNIHFEDGDVHKRYRRNVVLPFPSTGETVSYSGLPHGEGLSRTGGTSSCVYVHFLYKKK